MNRRLEKLKQQNKIVALTQAEIDYVASYAEGTPVLVMLANTVALMRNEIRRINAEYILEQASEGNGAEALHLIGQWKESRKDG